MCIDGVGHLVLGDERIQTLMSDPRLDLVHQQVVMALYSLNAQGRLGECEEILPIYLSMSSEKCAEILDTIVGVGLLVRTESGFELAYPVAQEGGGDSCACHV